MKGKGKVACWWHEQTGKKVWTEPTAEQMRTGGVVRKSLSPTRPPSLSAKSPKHRAITPRPVVPLELPSLSPRSASKKGATILADTPVKPRLKVGPVPRQRSARCEQDAAFTAQKMRDVRLQRQRAVELETYHTAFRILDLDGSGKVEPYEVLSALKRMGKRVDERRFWEVFRDLDLDNSSSLEFNEFQIVLDTLARKKGPNAGIADPVRAIPQLSWACVFLRTRLHIPKLTIHSYQHVSTPLARLAGRFFLRLR